MSESPAESPGSQRNEPIFDKYAEDSEERSSRSTNETPNSELSPPDSPAAKSVTLADDKRANARSLAASLPLEEQVSLLTAADFWRSKAIPDKGIPAFKTSDGPNGARGAIFKAGTKAALFPCGISLAASWNTDLLFQVGEHLAEETKARSAQVLLAPTVCLHRGPLGGRNFESFSEDPHLTGKLAASYINGLQGKGVAATIKHFVANEQETERFKIDSLVQERALRELYLRPFEIAIREANPWAVMSSYNLINGVHADMNEHTLKDILRGEWAYDGLVMSDWGGTNSYVESIETGCDIEMPVSTLWRGAKTLAAVENGDLSKEAVEKAAANVLYLVERTKGSDMSAELAEREDDREETRQLIRDAGAEGLTLLKNEGSILPIKTSDKIAVIGPNANRAIAGGGGSASLNPYYNTLPLDSIKAVAEKDVRYAVGCQTYKWLPLAADYCKTATGEQGVSLEFHIGDKFEGKPRVIQQRTNTDLFLWDSVPLEVGNIWSCRAKTILTPKTTGLHTISFSSVGAGRLIVNGRTMVDIWDWTEKGEAMFDDSQQQLFTMQLKAGKPIEIVAELTNELRPFWRQKAEKRTHGNGGVRIGYKEEDKKDYLQEAVDAAKASDVAVIIVGLDGEWESEGYDRTTMDLPADGSQDRLIEAILKANPRTIVVNQSGSPVTMPWADRVPAIVQAWYQGQEAGNALADVLFGFKTPSGKLPTTFPKRLEDNPTYLNWPGENLKVLYGEGLYIGYRHYEAKAIAPLFPFGHGLSYTTFAYGKPKISSSVLTEDGKLTITIPVKNTGSVEGAEIVQAYIHDEKSRLQRPEKELQAFTKVYLKPGETKNATLTLDKYSVGYYDTDLSSWIAEEGVFQALIGASSVDIREKCSFEVTKSFTWIF
ncbi:probable periplasmic beta-glucosidase precursor [Phialocephala subalpina]|uniref:beta-glucosidase n=1 Tax=Phialocephala subalpina TaxID=576137 RepID=A0A1L7WR18_9HELO|nr:probable periplasmic beta-glucosidase precursor [Phialocephala subalpina]